MAASREEAFASLRQQGIKAIKVIEIVSPLKKRFLRSLWILVPLFVAVLVSAAFLFGRSGASPAGRVRALTPRPRHQLVSTIDPGKVFQRPAERYLALFIEPGKDVVPGQMTAEVKSDFFDAINSQLFAEPSDDAVVIEAKRIVVGVKEEAHMYLSAGKSLDEIDRWLTERQRMERDYRRQLLEDVADREGCSPDELREKRSRANALLETMGCEPLETLENKY